MQVKMTSSAKPLRGFSLAEFDRSDGSDLPDLQSLLEVSLSYFFYFSKSVFLASVKSSTVTVKFTGTATGVIVPGSYALLPLPVKLSV